MRTDIVGRQEVRKKYESKNYHNVVFVGRDKEQNPRYAAMRGTEETRYRGEARGSEKAYGFGHIGTDEKLFVFESPIDLLSYITAVPEEWEKHSYISLGGLSEKAMKRMYTEYPHHIGTDEKLFVFESPIDLLSYITAVPEEWEKHSYISLGGLSEKAMKRMYTEYPHIHSIYLCLDNDEPGNERCRQFVSLIPEELSVYRLEPVKKDWNECLVAEVPVYRNYTAQDVETLKKISVYRKLGISIKDIQSLLETGDKSILLRIYQEKVQEKVLKDSELEALKQFIDDGDADKANEALDYQTVENAIESLLPGKEWGDYFKSHFKPFLNVRLKTLEQKQALQNILEYCDETTLKVPFIMGIGAKMIGGIAQETRTADEMIAYYRDMSESEYERLKEKVWKGAKMKNGIMKYHPAFIAQRKMQKELQNKGYNDIFIPNLMVLSPTYAEYKKALDNVNDRMCRELGLYYDSNYNLVIKKDNLFIPNLMVLSPTYAEYKKALDNVNDRMCRELGLYYDSNYNLVIKKDNSK